MTAGRLRFTKLEALANDFVLIDARSSEVPLQAAQIRQLGDRRLGIGFDQLLRLVPATAPGHVCAVEIFNRDGSSAEQCGNGMRAIALWLDQNNELPDNARLQTAGGSVGIHVDDSDHIDAELSVPDFSPAAWGRSDGLRHWEVTHDRERYRVTGVAIGNPHVVVELAQAPDGHLLNALGKMLGQASELAHGANVNLAWLRDRQHIELAVYERGTGPTRACGSGACATAAVLVRAGRAHSPLRITQPGGELVIHWNGADKPITMSGPARRVFDGTATIPSPSE